MLMRGDPAHRDRDHADAERQRPAVFVGKLPPRDARHHRAEHRGSAAGAGGLTLVSSPFCTIGTIRTVWRWTQRRSSPSRAAAGAAAEQLLPLSPPPACSIHEEASAPEIAGVETGLAGVVDHPEVQHQVGHDREDVGDLRPDRWPATQPTLAQAGSQEMHECQLGRGRGGDPP